MIWVFSEGKTGPELGPNKIDIELKLSDILFAITLLFSQVVVSFIPRDIRSLT
jgi:hypothetical protein